MFTRLLIVMFIEYSFVPLNTHMHTAHSLRYVICIIRILYWMRSELMFLYLGPNLVQEQHEYSPQSQPPCEISIVDRETQQVCG